RIDGLPVTNVIFGILFVLVAGYLLSSYVSLNQQGSGGVSEIILMVGGGLLLLLFSAQLLCRDAPIVITATIRQGYSAYLMWKGKEVPAPTDDEIRQRLGYESEEPTLAEGEASRVHMFLFDTSPPSYTLNSDYRILDWNPAFELVFNTSELHHGDHVSHWINQLSNKEQIHRHAKEVFADNRIPLADVEPIEFFSPVF